MNILASPHPRIPAFPHLRIYASSHSEDPPGYPQEQVYPYGHTTNGHVRNGEGSSVAGALAPVGRM